MRMWVHNPHTGGKSIPPAVKARTERRILDYANKHFAGKFTRIDVRFRGVLCYIDAYTEPDMPRARVLPGGATREQWIERLRNTPSDHRRISRHARGIFRDLGSLAMTRLWRRWQ